MPPKIITLPTWKKFIFDFIFQQERKGSLKMIVSRVEIFLLTVYTIFQRKVQISFCLLLVSFYKIVTSRKEISFMIHLRYINATPQCEGMCHASATRNRPIKFNVDTLGYYILCNQKQSANSLFVMYIGNRFFNVQINHSTILC
ncbi:unnamed protein product [Paramecium pentaurelia]|uniref:Uncharacterized protein n=1 Tax=Paramecium pentaurelia TaxID=43138 RepID=A0A8S1W7P0_9CILI|nr:unnamed protein product [Paramecium pentaurelia]